MHKQRTVLLLAAVILGLAVATVALAAALVLDDDGTPVERSSPSTAAGANTPTPEPSPTVAAATQPDGVPDDVWALLQPLPEKLRDDLLQRFESGAMDVDDLEAVVQQYEDRNQGVRVGTVLEATDTLLRLEVFSTGERAEVAIDGETVLRRGLEDITPADLQTDELVMVISMDGGKTAFAITAFGVGAP